MYSRFYICRWHIKIGITFLDFKSENLVVQIVLHERPWQSIVYSGNKDLWDRSRGLLGLSQSKYIEKILKGFSINLTKKGFIPIVDGKHLSKFMYPKTHKGREIMIGFHMPQSLDRSYILWYVHIQIFILLMSTRWF